MMLSKLDDLIMFRIIPGMMAIMCGGISVFFLCGAVVAHPAFLIPAIPFGILALAWTVSTLEGPP